MTQCPECGSGNIEMGSGDCRDDGQGYSWVTTYSCSCNECGCVFDKIEETEVSYEVDEHGDTHAE